MKQLNQSATVVVMPGAHGNASAAAVGRAFELSADVKNFVNEASISGVPYLVVIPPTVIASPVDTPMQRPEEDAVPPEDFASLMRRVEMEVYA